MSLAGWAILGVLVLLVVYVWFFMRMIRTESRQNHKMSEEELWYSLWPAIAALPETKRVEIRNAVNVIRFNHSLGEGNEHGKRHKNSAGS